MATDGAGSPGGLVIVTGPSHVGKSTLISELEKRSQHPSVAISIDETIAEVNLPEAELWEHGLSLAYDLAAKRTEQLLTSGILVFYESTFTYVPPPPRPPELHREQLQRLLQISAQLGSEAVLVRLAAALGDVFDRQRASGRLNATIMRETWRLHASCPLEAPVSLHLDASRYSASNLADFLVDRIGL